MLGIREPDIYGKRTYKDLVDLCMEYTERKGIVCELFQSNHEGEIVDKIQSSIDKIDGIVINPASYTHTSLAIGEAIKAIGIPAVEVHITDPDSREDFRKINYIREFCIDTVKGESLEGYIKAINILEDKLI